MGETSIRTVGLTKAYRSGAGELVVLKDLDLEVPQGTRLALVGESGAGKSTLLHLLGGLDRPTSGTVFYGSRDIFSLPADELAALRNREIGFVWQNQSLLPEFTALENVMMPLLVRGTASAEAAARARESLAEVGLAARAHHRAGEMSGGEQQRAVLARALAGRPRVLLADEPTGNLDHQTGEAIIEMLARLHRTHGLTSVIVTHNLSLAARCDRILQLKGGAVTEAPSGAGTEGQSGAKGG